MTFSRLSKIGIVLCLFLLFGTVSGAQAARKPRPGFAIKFATLAPEGSAWMKAMHEIDDQVRQRTENRVGFKFYPGGVQGDEKDVLRKIRNGQLHGGGFSGFGLGAVASEVRVLELPFMFRDHTELDFVREELSAEFDQVFTDGGYTNLGWVDVGFIHIFSKQPVATPAELEAARMWIWAGDPLAELFFNAFDLAPIPLAAPDVLTSLQTGVIDAAYSSTLACVALQWFTRVSYMTDVPITHGLGAALLSDKALRKVSAADLALIREVSDPILRRLTEQTRQDNLDALAEMKKEGLEVVAVADEVRDWFYTTGQAAWGDGVGKLFSRDRLDQVQALLQTHRAAASPAAGH